MIVIHNYRLPIHNFLSKTNSRSLALAMSFAYTATTPTAVPRSSATTDATFASVES